VRKSYVARLPAGQADGRDASVKLSGGLILFHWPIRKLFAFIIADSGQVPQSPTPSDGRLKRHRQ
jgi:hypothetical protein